ncbi:transposon Tf2-1 polyprotein isoform X1 [Cucumis melo var. makuwa]|uniref:Transposon Tf2-1 polyprotein isoform X1 n=1 Tax=Cucumis melo var. makuwa TaxID=1194695 RepID=A0A5D3BWS4_CUCMM|nr:transposon Tf2-1 polyprotein isoform X1 [Cucumis melo var. makuwa]
MHLCQLTAPALLDLLVIKEEVEKNIKLKEIIEKLQNEEDVADYSLQQRILKYKSSGELYWEGMKGDVKKYCEECAVCQHNKTLALSPTAKSVVEVFVNEVVQLHGYPRSIVSNRDKVFFSNFWHEMFRLSITKLNRSSAYHPQSNSQSELVNQSVEAYLHCSVPPPLIYYGDSELLILPLTSNSKKGMWP